MQPCVLLVGFGRVVRREIFGQRLDGLGTALERPEFFREVGPIYALSVGAVVNRRP
jgi:hypothetical protein